MTRHNELAAYLRITLIKLPLLYIIAIHCNIGASAFECNERR